MNVLVVESPAKAKSINKYLGDRFRVLASIGHIRDLSANNNAINKEEVKTHIKVIGKYFINSPANPGQKISGKKAAKVVAVEAIIGNAIFLDAAE